MDFALRVVVVAIIVLVAVFIVIMVMNTLTGEGISVMDYMAEYFEGFASAFS